ncbi:helix-turn-helix transcriptional regulator [Halomonas shantousis]
MDNIIAIEAFAALAQPTRLETFRLLARHEPEGLPAGEIARLLEVPHNTMSTHLGVLSRAGLVISRRHSRSVIYRANLERIRETVGFLIHDCCAGHPELCAPLLQELRPCTSSREDDLS